MDDGRPLCVVALRGPGCVGASFVGAEVVSVWGLQHCYRAWSTLHPSELAPGHPLPLHQGSPQDSGLQLSAGTLFVLLSLSVPRGQREQVLLPASSSLVDPASTEHWLDPTVFRLTLSSQHCWFSSGLMVSGLVAWPHSRALSLTPALHWMPEVQLQLAQSHLFEPADFPRE